MIGIILFVVAVFVWDGLKKKMRGPKIPTVSMKPFNIIKAKCGCSTEDGLIIKPCAAHELLIKL